MTVEDEYKCAPAFAMLEARLAEDGANLVKKVNGVYCFKVGINMYIGFPKLQIQNMMLPPTYNFL